LERHAVASHVGVVCTGGGQVVGDDGVSVVILTGGLTPPTDPGLPHVVVHSGGPQLAAMRHNIPGQVGVMRTDRLHPLLARLGAVRDALSASIPQHLCDLTVHRCTRPPLRQQLARALDQVRKLLIRHQLQIDTHHATSHSMPSRPIQYVSRATHAYIDPVLDTSTDACCADEPPHATMKRCVSAGASFAAMSPDQIWYPDLLDARKGFPDASATRPRRRRVFPRRPIARLYP